MQNQPNLPPIFILKMPDFSMHREIQYKEIAGLGGEAGFQRFKVSFRELSSYLLPRLHPESNCLEENHANQLQLTGLDGAYCVDATARGALNRGYHVTLFLDGIATESSTSIEKLAQGWREAGAQVRTGTDM